MPYMYPDLNAARALADAGAACIMPLGSPIDSNKGLSTKDFIQILIDEIDLPIIVDAGIGRLPRLVKPWKWVLPLSWQILLSQLQEMFLPWQKLSKKPLKARTQCLSFRTGTHHRKRRKRILTSDRILRELGGSQNGKFTYQRKYFK